MPTSKLKVPPELQEISQQVGEFIQYWGFKSIHGQIWTHIYLSAVPLDATTLVKRLGVSKALVSLAVKDLLDYEVIRYAGKGQRRKLLLEANPDVYHVIARVLRLRERKMLSLISSSFKNIKKAKTEDHTIVPLDLNRIGEMGKMIGLAEECLDALIASEMMVDVKPAK